jgi:hypothetical protein
MPRQARRTRYAGEQKGARCRLSSLAALKKNIEDWSADALRLVEVELPRHEQDLAEGRRLVFNGSMDYFYNQRSADMESTWVALHALALCAEVSSLPEAALRPDFLQPIPQTNAKASASQPGTPEPSLVILGRSVKALTALHEDGAGWNEANFHQPVRHFDAFSEWLAVPALAESFPPLKSTLTPASAVQGFIALASIGKVVGEARMAAYMPIITAGGVEVDSALMGWRDKQWAAPERAALLPADSPPILLAAAAGTAPKARCALLARHLVLSATPEGGWRLKGERRIFLPSSLRERHQALSGLEGQIWEGTSLNRPAAMNKAHVQEEHLKLGAASYQGDTFATATAILCLAAFVDQPAAALQRHAHSSDLPALLQQVRGKILPPGGQ